MLAGVKKGLGEQRTIPDSDFSDHAAHPSPASSGDELEQANTSGSAAGAFDRKNRVLILGELAEFINKIN